MKGKGNGGEMRRWQAEKAGGVSGKGGRVERTKAEVTGDGVQGGNGEIWGARRWQVAGGEGGEWTGESLGRGEWCKKHRGTLSSP